ncbi:hypothetical protein ACEZCY_03400 [Streptacidiphilus sp. N1-12]|uniref:Uncharacterized protein n=2 Tax=Streptacidiphilus alkalitolerans TaxID=3342712 RepID=A0ABV6V3N6_9ACTN
MNAVRRFCARLVEELQIPGDCDLDGLVQHIARVTGRELTARPAPLGPRVSGLTLATDTHGLILYQRHTTVWHQTGIVLHELGHLACRHESSPEAMVEAARLLAQVTDPAQMAQHFSAGVHARHHGYHKRAELEAEEFAVQVTARLPLLAVAGSSQAVDRLAPSLEHRRPSGAP